MRVSLDTRLAGPGFTAEVPSSRGPGFSYQVTLLPDGTWLCACPGFRYQARADGLCRHVDMVQGAGERAWTLADLLE